MARSDRTNKRRKEPELPPQADERNLVEASEQEDTISTEERAQELWDRYKNPVIAGVGLVFLAIVFMQGIRWMRTAAENQTQAAYQSALAEDSLAAFGEKHEAHTLGGVAHLKLANEAFAEEDFAAAAELYKKAAKGMTGTPLQARAQIGEGVSLIRAGETVAPAGLEILEKVASNEDAAAGIRAEALYHLAIHALAQGDEAGYNQLVSRIENLEGGEDWLNRANAIRPAV